MMVNGVRHIRTAPYHPASNGAAERLVQTVKQAIRAGNQEGTSIEKALAKFLLQYRSTPHPTTGVAPCELLLGRSLRTRLDLLKPDIGGRVRDHQGQQKARHDRHSRSREFDVGEHVWTRNLREGPRWMSGTIVDRLGPLSYMIRLPNGDLWRRHVDHLRQGVCSSTELTELPEDTISDEFVAVPTSPAVEVQPDSASTMPDQSDENSGVRMTQDSRPVSGSEAKQYPTRTRKPPDRLYGTLSKSEAEPSH